MWIIEKEITNFKIEKKSRYLKMKTFKKFVSFLVESYQHNYQYASASKSKQIKYGCLISNTNRSDQPDTHWWNITDNRHHSLRPYWVGREVKIKSIHNDDFSKMCVGSLIKKKWDVMVSMILLNLKATFIWGIPIFYFALRSPMTARMKRLFSQVLSKIILRFFEKKKKLSWFWLDGL